MLNWLKKLWSEEMPEELIPYFHEVGLSLRKNKHIVKK